MTVITGFQGVNKNLRLTTIWRSGSDASAIMLAKIAVNKIETPITYSFIINDKFINLFLFKYQLGAVFKILYICYYNQFLLKPIGTYLLN